jgi:hypothetical protein
MVFPVALDAPAEALRFGRVRPDGVGEFADTFGPGAGDAFDDDYSPQAQGIWECVPRVRVRDGPLTRCHNEDVRQPGAVGINGNLRSSCKTATRGSRHASRPVGHVQTTGATPGSYSPTRVRGYDAV